MFPVEQERIRQNGQFRMVRSRKMAMEGVLMDEKQSIA